MKNMNSRKVTLVLLSIILILCATIGGTLAWLMDTTDPVTNTFTVGKIEITLDEAKVDEDGNFLKGTTKVDTLAEADRVTANAYQVIPGKTYTKDPTLTVKKGNEACYLFVKFEEDGNPATYYEYTSMLTTANGWTPGDDTNGVPEGVWFRTVPETPADAAKDTVFYMLKDNLISVKETVTAETMTAATGASLKWTAYAVQTANDDATFTPEHAWDIAEDGDLDNP